MTSLVGVTYDSVIHLQVSFEKKKEELFEMVTYQAVPILLVFLFNKIIYFYYIFGIFFFYPGEHTCMVYSRYSAWLFIYPFG